MYDVIEFLSHQPQNWQTFARYHVVDIHKYFSWKLYHVSLSSLEITIVLNFFGDFFAFLKNDRNTPILKILKISEKSNYSEVA